mgnify:FL=1
MSKWIRKGDKVLVIAGNDKGKIGTVLSRGKTRVLVEGVNIRKKHMKAQSEEQKAQILSIEMPIHISNVQLVFDDAPIRVRVRLDQETGEKLLVYTKGAEERTYRPVK